MTLRWRCVAAAAVLLPTPATATCTDLMPARERPVVGLRRPITAEAVIGLRFIGEPSAARLSGPSPLGISPDARYVAFVLSRPDLSIDGDCQALVVVDLADGRTRVVDTGGSRMTEDIAVRGVRITDGWPAVVTPVWSPDGRSIGYLKRGANGNELWVASVDGSGARRLSGPRHDVVAWRWNADGHSATFTAYRGRAEVRSAILRSGREGFLYDARLWPDWGSTPLPSAADRATAFVSDGGDEARPATPEQARLLAADAAAVASSAETPEGERATLSTTTGGETGPRQLIVTRRSGERIACPDDVCGAGVSQFWWQGKHLLFLRRSGWANEITSLYRWMPGQSPRRLMATPDALLGCVSAGQSVACIVEGSLRPARVVLIDQRAGTIRTLFDTNPAFGGFAIGRVIRLRVTNAFGLRSWADLVLPPGYRAGTRLPTIVVQYHSRGLLRGGTGDEYPILAYAARGYAVLSLERPPPFGSNDPAITTYAALNAAGLRAWSERRNLFSSVMASIDAAVAGGWTDRSRVGITGLSDGASTVQYAMVNSRAFAAAAISSGLFAPTLVMINGIGWADFNRTLGYPSLIDPDPAYWKPMSIAANARGISTPLLMQMADREYRQGLEGFEALREAKKPVELHVFPDEFHVKVRPRHRLAVFTRSLDWFDFWLRHIEDPDPGKADQYARWHALRDADGRQ